jgi:hypothetical protein
MGGQYSVSEADVLRGDSAWTTSPMKKGETCGHRTISVINTQSTLQIPRYFHVWSSQHGEFLAYELKE